MARNCKIFKKYFSNKSCFEEHADIYRFLMKENFDAYVLRPFDKKLIFELVHTLMLATIW